MKAISEEKKEKIRQMRRLGMTQKAIAGETGVSASTVQGVLQGKRGTPDRSGVIPRYMWDEWDRVTAQMVSNALSANARNRKQENIPRHMWYEWDRVTAQMRGAGR